MKKLTVFSLLVATVAIFSYCNSSKKAAAKTETKVATVYAANVESAMLANCAPCHFPAKGGNKKPLDTYAAVRDNIDDIIRRIELNPTDRGFMPFKKTAKLDEATINLFKKWKADGTAEK
ncbi:MAG: hypothetical protein E6H07_12020 [Bacteroidetes bacterium]|nr:MAG: hypothetical protein E6H07_12020 [Bacteroidota bacterium]